MYFTNGFLKFDFHNGLSNKDNILNYLQEVLGHLFEDLEFVDLSKTK